MIGLGCLPKDFPEIGRFNKGDGDASENKITAEFSDEAGGLDDEAVHDTAAIRSIHKIDNTEVSNHGAPSQGGQAVRQAVGDCDPESDLPCSCPRRQFREPPESLPMPATASNREALEIYIKD